MLYQNLTKDDNEYRRIDTPARDQVEQTSSSTSQVERTEYKAGDKEDWMWILVNLLLLGPLNGLEKGR